MLRTITTVRSLR